MQKSDITTNSVIKQSLPKRIVITLLLLAAGVLLFATTIFFIMPTQLIEAWIVEGVRKKSGIVLSGEAFQRALPFGFAFTNLSLRKKEGGEEFFAFDRLEARIHPMALITGKVRITLTGITEEGGIAGEVLLRRRGIVAHIDGRNITLHSLPSQPVQGMVTIGSFMADLSLANLYNGCPTGTATARGLKTTTQGVTIIGFPSPLGDIDEVGLQAMLSDCAAQVERIWLESRNLTARLKGRVVLTAPLQRSRIDMLLEVIPKEELLDNRLLTALMGKYRKSANYYSIPVRGTLEHPLLAQ
ncbi:MAG: type II secretion system protein GspN [Deltaproteobacteria bacterium]|nr:type II secretion system protein GspN [Deltaproteobacteria bacterium]